MAGEFNDDTPLHDKYETDLGDKSKVFNQHGQMDIDENFYQGRLSENNKLVMNIGKVVQHLRSLGFTSMTEDAYASAIFLLLKVNTYYVFCVSQLVIPYYFLSPLPSLQGRLTFSFSYGRLQYTILLVMIIGLLFWSPLRSGYRFPPICILTLCFSSHIIMKFRMFLKEITLFMTAYFTM